MDSYRTDGRRRLSVTLDAGYVSIAPVDLGQTSKTFGLYGKKLICVICVVISLFLISFINLTCLLWFMHKLDWSLLDGSRSKIFRYDKTDRQFQISGPLTCQEPVHTIKINHTAQIDLLIDKQIDISGDQNSILFDDDQILFNTDNFSFQNNTSIDFTNLESYQFDEEIETRVRLSQLNSQYIHNKHLNITATNQLTISNVKHVSFRSQNLVLQANRYNRPSVLRFDNFPKNKKKSSLNRHQKMSHGNLRIKSDSIFFDLPRYTSLNNNNYRSESNVYRICICNTTFLFLRSFAHQPCPLC